MATYKEQYLHPAWQKKRLEVMELHGFACAACASTEKTLHVHHKRYVKGRKVWEYENDDLVCLCDDCHEATHQRQQLLAKLLNEVDLGAPGEVVAIGLLAGYAYAACGLYDDETEKAARALSGPFFEEGMKAYAAALAPSAKFAAVVQQAVYMFGGPTPQLRTELERWASMVEADI